MKKLIFALVILALVTLACNLSSAPIATLMPTLVVAQPTYTPYPTQVPPTAYPTAKPLPTQVPPTAAPLPSSKGISSVLFSAGFVDAGAGDCGTLACEDYTYRSGTIAVNFVVSAGGFGMSAPPWKWL
jgi:hypothetical protein